LWKVADLLYSCRFVVDFVVRNPQLIEQVEFGRRACRGARPSRNNAAVVNQKDNDDDEDVSYVCSET